MYGYRVADRDRYVSVSERFGVGGRRSNDRKTDKNTYYGTSSRENSRGGGVQLMVIFHMDFAKYWIYIRYGLYSNGLPKISFF
jgi:hypothetical protein